MVIRDTHVIREIPCPDRNTAIAYSSLVSDFYRLGYDRCVFEIHKVNEIFNQYGMSAIKTKKDDWMFDPDNLGLDEMSREEIKEA